MAVKLDTATWMNNVNKLVVFDLEFVGNIAEPTECHLWEIGAVHMASGDAFHVIVDPNIETIPDNEEGCFHLTQSFLDQNSVSLKMGLQMFIGWANKYRLLVSHNCFKSDLGVLCGALAKCGLHCPSWLFIDSLLMLRRRLPSLKNYKLSTVYSHFKQSEMEISHRALSDAYALKSVLLAMGPPRDVVFAYPMTLTPLQNIRGVGYACEVDLVRKGFFSAESLIEKILCEKAAMSLWQDVDIATAVDKVVCCLQLPIQDMATVKEYIVRCINRKHLCKNE